MNALANSQEEELRKFLDHGVDGEPVRFARYTRPRKTKNGARRFKTTARHHLDELRDARAILTRIRDKDLVKAAQGLRFLVLDELHTYRGRQGADVGLLVRRVRHATKSQNLQVIGTSATLASGGTWEEERA